MLIRRTLLRILYAPLVLLLFFSTALADTPEQIGGSPTSEPATEPAGDTDVETGLNPEEAELARKLDEIAASDTRLDPQSDPQSIPNFGGALVQMVAVLALVCLLAYFFLGKLLPRILRVEAPSAPQRILKVVDRMPIDQRRSLMVVRMSDQHWLIGITEQGITMLSRLDAQDVEDAIRNAEEARPRLGRLANVLVGRSAEDKDKKEG